jgi:hypothetical protein
MLQSRVVVAAVLLSTLCACGGSEDDEAGQDKPAPVDRRPTVTGSYSVTGTVNIVSQGERATTQVEDTLRVSNDGASTAAVRLIIGSMGCGPRARMTRDYGFSTQTTECPLPPDDGCTFTLVYGSGHGHKSASGTLTVSLQGQLIARCGDRTATADIFMDLSGSRVAQSPPGQQEGALTRPTGLDAAMEQLARSLGH